MSLSDERLREIAREKARWLHRGVRQGQLFEVLRLVATETRNAALEDVAKALPDIWSRSMHVREAVRAIRARKEPKP